MVRWNLVAMLFLMVMPALAEDRFDTFEAAALIGNYQAQRNAAYCLRTAQCSGVVTPRKLDACAWRLVIVGAGDKRVDASDVANVEFDCVRQLTEPERGVAQRKADTLFRKIYGRSLEPF